jgi:hypothetical protein
VPLALTGNSEMAAQFDRFTRNARSVSEMSSARAAKRARSV